MRYIYIHTILSFLFSYYCNANPPANLTATKNNIHNELKKIPQNSLEYLDIINGNKLENTDLSIAKEKRLKKFLHYIYLPWSNNPISTAEYIKKIFQRKKNYLLHYVGINRQPYTSQWKKKMNKNIEELHKISSTNAIVINNSHLRQLPTDDPFFVDNFDKYPGQGYPFDLIQTAKIPINTPIKIIATTKNKDWQYAISGNYGDGWIKTKDIAYVDDQFITLWKNNNQYITPIHEDISIYNAKNNIYLQKTKIGQVFPSPKKNLDTQNYTVLLAVKDFNTGYAKIIQGKINKKHAIIMPYTFIPYNIALVCNQLLDKPYMWGSLGNYRDCSGTLQDLYIPFAIRLPRDSIDQAKAGKYIDLKNLSVKNKIEIIKKKALVLKLYYGFQDTLCYI